MKQLIRRLIKLLMLLIVVLTIVVISRLSKDKEDMFKLQEDIASSLIRFHIRANSDSDEDQQLKLKVKDSVITYLEPLLSDSQSLDESRVILNENHDTIVDIAMQVIASEGYNYQVDAYFEQSYFPMKSYGDITLPPGEYEAYRIDIGENAGKNWWCVLYPPLCFIDATHGELPESSKNQLKNMLSEESYDSITKENYICKFKYLSFLN